MSARYMQPLRNFIQLAFLLFSIWLSFSFYLFVQAVSTGAAELAERPAGVEGFLPISGLLGAASWAKGGGINTIHPAAVIIFFTVITVSLLLRRSFCSWICPVAAVSEFAWKSGFRFFNCNLRLPAWLDIAIRGLKYLLLFFFIYFIAIAMSPDALLKFISSDYHKIADIRLLYFFLNISPFALTIILLLTVLSLVVRNPFCRYICPYGALLGLAAMFSPLRVTRNIERCVSCGACSQVCPTYIDVMHKTSVVSPECIACWRCISHCRFNEALSMKALHRYNVPGVVFAILVVLLFWGGTYIGKFSGHWQSSISLNEYVRLLGK